MKQATVLSPQSILYVRHALISLNPIAFRMLLESASDHIKTYESMRSFLLFLTSLVFYKEEDADAFLEIFTDDDLVPDFVAHGGITAVDEQGITALHVLASRGHDNPIMTKALLQRAAQPLDDAGNITRAAPLFLACRNAHSRSMRVMLDYLKEEAPDTLTPDAYDLLEYEASRLGYGAILDLLQDYFYTA